MTHDQLGWEQILRQAGHRVTRQRGVILDAVCASGGHASLGEIHLRVHRHDPSIDVSTVYRALRLFVDVGLVVVAESPAGEHLYEVRHPQPHHHLTCRDCGAELEMDQSVTLPMVEAIRDRYGYTVTVDHLNLVGTCPQCARRAGEGGAGWSPTLS